MKDLTNENAGSTFTKAVANMYEKTYYVPKINANRTGEPIESVHGVTQGRKSSTSLFSFTMRNIPKAVKLPPSILSGHHVFQLADDSSLVVTSSLDLVEGFGQLIDASDKKFMVTNTTKTYYLHLCDEPMTDDLQLPNGTNIKAAENNEHLCLGMWFTASASITKQMMCNLDHRNHNIKKFYDWLDVNMMTPISIKLTVLDACMFAAYLYGSECWATFEDAKDKLLSLERKLLKHVLQVKASTPNALIYKELERCDLATRIKVCQKNFYQKCKKLTKEDSVLATLLDLCKGLDFLEYYENLGDGMIRQFNESTKLEILTATTTYCERYRDLTGLSNTDIIYRRFLREDKRIVLTKWRLSSHDLHIEQGRYTSPITPRADRTCKSCASKIEDEHHVLFQCPLYNIVRLRFLDLFIRLNTVNLMLNPVNIEDAEMVGDVLLQIEKIRSREL